MSLRRGLALVSLVSAGTVVVLVLVIAAQYLFTTSAQRSLFDVLAPAADDSAELVLTQTRASDALNDYIVTGDDQALAAFGSSMAQADELLGRLDSIIGYSAYSWLIAHVRMSLVSTYAFVNPVVAVILGVIILREAITLDVLIGLIVVVGSVGLIVLGERQSS